MLQAAAAAVATALANTMTNTVAVVDDSSGSGCNPDMSHYRGGGDSGRNNLYNKVNDIACTMNLLLLCILFDTLFIKQVLLCCTTKGIICASIITYNSSKLVKML